MTDRLADLTVVNVPYIIEVYVNGKIDRTTTIPLGPEVWKRTRTPPTSHRYTFGGRPIREHSAIRAETIELSGRSGLTSRMGFDDAGLAQRLSGPEILEAFGRFLEKYNRTAEQEGAHYLATPDTYRDGLDRVFMVFRSLNENVAFRVEPGPFSYWRSTQTSRFSYEWRLVLEAYGATTGDLTDKYASPLGTIKDALAASKSFLASATTFLIDARKFLKKANKIVSGVRKPLNDFLGVIVQARGIIEQVTTLVAAPRAVYADALLSAEQVRAAFRDAADSLGPANKQGILSLAERTKRLFDRSSEMESDALVTYGLAHGNARELAAAKQASDDAPGGQAVAITSVVVGAVANDQAKAVTTYTLSAGETLKDVAQKLFGDPNQWFQIALLNGMTSAYLDAIGAPLVGGTQIFVPSTNLVFAEIASLGSPDDLLGEDLYISPVTWDFEVGVDGLDIRYVHGRDNYVQAVRDRALTPRGEVKGWPQYGLVPAPGTALTPEAFSYVVSHVVEQMERDPRTKAVKNVAVVDEGDGISISADVTPILGADLALIAPLLAA